MFIPSNLLSPLLLATTLALSTTTVSAQDVTAGSCSGTVDRPACSSLSQPDLQRLFSCHQQLKDSGALNPLLDQHSVTDWNAAHFNCLFLHWHRAFLRKFEILLKGTCPDVNLCWLDYYTYPEWWTHPVFSIPSSEPREPRQNAIQEQIDAVFLALLKPTFSEFCFLMEVSGTHAAIHMNLGGTMATARSPADPVFFLHHASLDYIWSKWEGTHPSAAFECAYYQRQESMFPPQHSAYNRWEATQNLPSFTFSPSSIMSSSNICVNYLEPGAAASLPPPPQNLTNAINAVSANAEFLARNGVSVEEVASTVQTDIEQDIQQISEVINAANGTAASISLEDFARALMKNAEARATATPTSGAAPTATNSVGLRNAASTAAATTAASRATQAAQKGTSAAVSVRSSSNLVAGVIALGLSLVYLF